MHMCDVGLMMIFYVLLKPVSRNLALLAILFNLIQTAVLVANKLTLLLPLFLLGKAAYLTSFDPPQLQALAYVALRIPDHCSRCGSTFFVPACPLLAPPRLPSGPCPSVPALLC